MDVREAPATPTGEFRGMDDTSTFELFDGSSAIQNRKRRRSSLRRVSFAEQPSIHVFARDDDYETPPEGTVSHLSAQSTPTSVSRSPQRRSERLAAARGGRHDENEVDKENVPVSVGSNARQSRRGRRPLAVRDTQKEKEEEFLKPSNWLDDHENSAFGSCDDNTGPVDIRHITFDNQSVEVDDDDNMTMDSQTFHTRMSLMLAKQSLHRLSETTRTPGQFSDMESIHGQYTDTVVAWHERQALDSGRQMQEQPTWHRGDGSISDMSQGSLEELSIFRVLAKKKSSTKESSIQYSEDKTMEGRNNWAEDDAQSEGRKPSMQIKRTGSLLDIGDTVSMDTSSPQSNGGRRKLLVDEGERDPDIMNLRDSEGLDGSQLQGSKSLKDRELQATGPIMKKRTSMFDHDDAVAMEVGSQSHADGNDLTMEIDSGTDERLFFRDKLTSTTLKESETTAPECTARLSVHQAAEHSATLDNDNIAFNPSVKSGTSEDSPVPLKQYERKLKRMSTSAAEKDISVAIKPKMDSKSQLLRSEGHVESMPEEALARQQVGQYGQGHDGQESFSQHRIVNKESRKSMGLQACDGFVSQGIEPETLLSAPDENTEPMDITRMWNERASQHTSVPARSSESAKSFPWVDKDQSIDMSDADMTEKYQEGITEAMPKLAFVLDGYNCDSPSAEPLNRILQRKSDVDAEDSPVYGVTAEIEHQEDTTADFSGQHDWRAEVSSDMSTTPLSPRRPNFFQRLVTKPQTVPVLTEKGLADSFSFQDGITAAIPNVQDLLAADARTPESDLVWNPRKIDWSAQQSSRQALGDEEVLRQPGIDQIEDETMHSMPDNHCTPQAQEEKENIFECMTEEAAKTLNQVSHSKEVRNSVASKMLLRMMSLQDETRAQAESSSDGESQQILRRTLQFQPESDSQLQSQSLRGDAEQQISAEVPDGTMEVESVKKVDEETDSTESRIESLRQESRRQKLLQEMQVAEERLAALERRSEELRERAQDCHKAIAKGCRNDSCFKMKGSAACCSQAHVDKLKKRCQLLKCMQLWDLKTTKTGDDQVLYEFKYWSLLTHSIFERKENDIEVTVSKSSIDINEESINQVYRHMNASLAWRWFLPEDEEVIQSQSLFYHVQGVNFKVMILLDLMEEVNKCRKYLVIPHFRPQTGTGLQLGLQFSNSELLFDFILLFDVRQVIHMRYSKRHEVDCATEMNQLDCTVEMESAGRFFGKKISEAEIKSAVASVVPGHGPLLRVCASIDTLMHPCVR